jgi:hypothetical protein
MTLVLGLMSKVESMMGESDCSKRIMGMPGNRMQGVQGREFWGMIERLKYRDDLKNENAW